VAPPALFVPDNVLSGVTKACRYEPVINRTYLEFAQHDGAAVVPARAGHPRDKAKAAYYPPFRVCDAHWG
jgi:transposase